MKKVGDMMKKQSRCWPDEEVISRADPPKAEEERGSGGSSRSGA